MGWPTVEDVARGIPNQATGRCGDVGIGLKHLYWPTGQWHFPDRPSGPERHPLTVRGDHRYLAPFGTGKGPGPVTVERADIQLLGLGLRAHEDQRPAIGGPSERGARSRRGPYAFWAKFPQ